VFNRALALSPDLTNDVQAEGLPFVGGQVTTGRAGRERFRLAEMLDFSEGRQKHPASNLLQLRTNKFLEGTIREAP